jgi:YaiO family outer membrane protein
MRREISTRPASKTTYLKIPAVVLTLSVGVGFGFGMSAMHSAFAQDAMTGPGSTGSTFDPLAITAPSNAPLPPEKSAIEAVAGHGSVNGGYGDTASYSLRGTQTMPFGVLQAEVVNQSRFGFTGNYGGLSLTTDLSPDYYITVGAGGGASLLFPSWRTDVTGFRKFGDKRQYVVGLGAYYAKGNEALRSDTGAILSGIYYADNLVLEAGLRINQADPGTAIGPSQYIAATIGSDDRRAFIVRYEHAKETYQVLTTGVAKVDFLSNSIGLQWRERISPQGMLIAGIQYYNSPNYSRTSFDLGWRWSFR